MDHDEYDTIVFEDFNLKFIKDSDSESEEEVEELDDEFVTSRYEDIRSIYEMMKEHFIYTGVRYFDKICMSDFNDYFHDTRCDIYHGLDINQDIPDFPTLSVRIRNPTIYEWIGMNYESLRLSYSYMKRLCHSRGLPNNTFHVFCSMGYETSTI